MEKIIAKIHPTSKKICYHVIGTKIPDYFELSCDDSDLFSKVTAVFFENCIMQNFPHFSSIVRHLSTLTDLRIQSSGITSINAENLFGFDCLIQLSMPHNNIETLPVDLFKHAQKLQEISFANNKIKYIDPFIIDNLSDLKIFNLLGNCTIDMKYECKISKKLTIKKFKTEILISCNPLWKQVENHRMESLKLEAKCNYQEKQISALKSKCKEQESQIFILKSEMMTKLYELEKQLDEKCETDVKDFAIIIGNNQFMINKALFTASSKLFDTVLDHGIDSLELKNTSEKTFLKIKDFLQAGKLPNESTNLTDLIDIFEASSRLEMTQLLQETRNLINKKLKLANYKDISDVIFLCDKMGFNEHRKKAMEMLMEELEKKSEK